MMRKKRADTDLAFIPGYNMLVHWVTSSLRPPLEFPPKIGARKLTSSWLVFNCLSLPSHISLFTLQKTRVIFSLLPGVSSWNIHFYSLHTYVHDLRPSSFPKSFLIITSVLSWLFRDYLIYLFIYSIPIFCESFNYITISPVVKKMLGGPLLTIDYISECWG